jgi:hypothetical protein
MLKKIAEALKGKEFTTELEKFQNEGQLIQGALNELNTEKAKFEGVEKMLLIELELDEKDASLKKRLGKVQNKLSEINGEIASHQERQAEVNQEIANEKARLKQEAIEEAGKVYEDAIYLQHKRTLASEQFTNLVDNFLYRKTGYYLEPSELFRLGGIKPHRSDSRFDPDNPAHEQLIEASKKASRAGREKAQKEFDQLMKQINEFLERNE